MVNCKTPYCRKTPTKGKRECSCCKMRRWRKSNPMKATYNNLKSNAKHRSKSFSLTFEQFKEFAIGTDYMLGKGRKLESFHIDRIIEEFGYHWWNIQKKTNKDNNEKYRAYIKYEYGLDGKPENYRMEKATRADSFEDVPF